MLKLLNKKIGLLSCIDNNQYGIFHLASIRDTLALREYICFMIIEAYSNKKRFYIEEVTNGILEQVKDNNRLKELEQFCELYKVFDYMHVMKAELMWKDLIANKISVEQIKLNI